MVIPDLIDWLPVRLVHPCDHLPYHFVGCFPHNLRRSSDVSFLTLDSSPMDTFSVNL